MTIGIDEQIAAHERELTALVAMVGENGAGVAEGKAILATLRRMKAIEDAARELPEPRSLRKARAYNSGGYVMGDVKVSDIIIHIDTLCGLLAAERVKRDGLQKLLDGWRGRRAQEWAKLRDALSGKISDTESLKIRLRELDEKGYGPHTGAIGEEAATYIEKVEAELDAERQQRLAAESRCKRLEDKYAALVDAAEKMQRMNGSCQRAMEQSGMNGVLSAMEKEQS